MNRSIQNSVMPSTLPSATGHFLFYVYLHCRPDGSPFYVGKGSGKRSHIFANSKRSQHHQNIVAKHGKNNIEVLVFPRESEAQALADEIQWIRTLREAGYELANLCDGGEGLVNPSESTRAKMSANGKVRKYSPETRAKLSIAKKARPLSTESCKKLSASKMGNKCGLGYKHTAESIAKMSAYRLGKKASPETCAKMSVAQLGNQNSRKKPLPIEVQSGTLPVEIQLGIGANHE
jgi:hypothetical protein